jgi:hypothetical protein
LKLNAFFTRCGHFVGTTPMISMAGGLQLFQRNGI